LCARIENAVSKFSMSVGRNRFAQVGISVGTATFGIDGETLDHLVAHADGEMYRVKSTHKGDRSVPVPIQSASSVVSDQSN
jgi:GGDEF domain-containing protein